jgi:quercetin 2,3-dioxygenase
MIKLMAAAAAAGCTPSHPEAGRMEEHRVEESERAVISVEPLGGMPWQTRDPFLFCVHHDDRYPEGNEELGPAASLRGRNLGQDFEGIDGWRMYHGEIVPGFPQHPHRGFETVTVVRSGLLDHSDSMGAAARYGRGDVQWLTAGSGIQHAEMFPLLERSAPNPVELFQIWLNLPARSKFAPPHFSMLWNEAVPRHAARDEAGRATQVTLVAGRMGELVPPSPPPNSWAAQAGSDVAIWTIKLDPGARWRLPAAARGTHRTLYYFRGTELAVGDRAIESGHRIELEPHVSPLIANGGDESELLLLQGRPIGEPVVQHGPFVMNSRREIQQAFADYQQTQFGGWPWQRHDPVHPREEERFARHADGRIERPV